MLAAGLLVAIGLVFFVGRSSAPVLRLEQATGEVWIGRERVPAPPGMTVPVGATVLTVGATSGVLIRADNGTRLVLAGDTSVQVENPGHFRVIVNAGNLTTEVAEGPGVKVTTPEVEVEAGAGRFAMGRAAVGTEVGVLNGAARVSDLTGNVLMDMSSGEVATVAVDGSRR